MPIFGSPVCRAASLIALALMLNTARAAPEMPLDPVSRFLAANGLLNATPAPNATPDSPATALADTAPADRPLVQQMRDTASDMVMTAMNFLGVPYRRGGESADDGFDCSGFTRHVFEMSLGLVLPRRADEQARAPGLVAVKRDELKPGDLVFFNTLRRTFSHVGIYLGDGKFIHSPKPGSEVRVDDIRLAYWMKHFTGARRAEPPADAGATATGTPPRSLQNPQTPAALPPSPVLRAPMH
jgi:cell wall-associated NlpC family hydrolase